MKRWGMVLLAALTVGFAAAARAQPAAPIQWLGGDLPPYIWQEDGAARGYGAELIAAMAEKLGRPSPIAFYPWARAVQTAREGSNYGILPLLRSPDREANFQWLIVLDHVRYSFFTRATAQGGVPAFAQSLAGLRPKRIGVLRGSPIIKNLQAENFAAIVEETGYVDLLRQLDAGNIDAVYVGHPMLMAVIRQSAYPTGHFVVGTTLTEGDLYLGASLTLDANEAQLWQKAYASLKRAGVVAKLRAKHGLDRLR